MIVDSQVVRLVPVIELAPHRYARQKREFPLHLSSNEEWDRYWHECLADSGITGLQPVRPRSWYVPIEQLTDTHTLEQMLHVKGLSSATDNASGAEVDRKNLYAFSGGYELFIDGRLMITPRCCGVLSDISEWRNAATYRRPEKAGVWVGHPSLYVQFDGTCLRFGEAERQETEWSGECLVAPDKLQEAIHQAEQELLAFAALLLPVVEKVTSSQDAAKITEILTESKFVRS